jgi:segregation and condensation protein A
MTDYKVKVEIFEGPLDLLLYLIKKEEVDIYEVNLTKIAGQFVEYVELMRELDLDVAGEFLVMAATLVYIKSRELLPVDQQTPAEGDTDETEDPRWELIRQLVEYKKFKDAAAQLQALEQRQELVYTRVPPRPELEVAPPAVPGAAGLFDLLGAVRDVLKRCAKREPLRDIFADKWTVSEKIEFILQTLRTQAKLHFSELFSASTSRSEVVVTFLAVLELMRLKQLRATQAEPFGEITLDRFATDPAGATPEAAAIPN